jgi:hypothetical protein
MTDHETGVNSSQAMIYIFQTFVEFSGDVTEYKKLMLNESFNKIKLQFLTDINELKSLVHFFVNHQYDNKISTFYKKIEENRQVFHV